ncbi:MAG: DUF4397 domain-containing protein [Verrucomicrobia bacterium]|nr:DUF4397 domain-containing protein [Verrucomicrobiota bacterium]
MKTFLFLLTGCIGCLQLVRAQTPEEPDSGPSVNTEFTLVGWAGQVSELAYRKNGRLQPVNAPAFERSKAYKYSGPARMGFYLPKNPAAKPKPDSKDTETPVATVTFEPGVKHYTVLLAEKNSNYQAQAIADDDGKFPVGSARVFNLCPMRLAIRCNQAGTTTLAPGKWEILNPGADHVLAAESAYEAKGTWLRANMDYIPVPPEWQTSVFFLLSDANYFKSIDGVGSRVQMIILREKPADREKPHDGEGR